MLAQGLILASCQSTSPSSSTPPIDRASVPPAAAAEAPAGLPRLNDFQVIGTHNSYKVAPERALLELISLATPRQAEAIDYSHLPITDQLNLGVRNLELDINNDLANAESPGGRFKDPVGNRLLRLKGIEPAPFNTRGELDAPGFKVLHDPDFDFRAHHHDLVAYLDEMREWSDAHPRHLPVIVTMNFKQGRSEVPGGMACPEFDRAAMERLDALILERFGDHRLLRPDSVRGGSPTLEHAVLNRGWPSMEACRGKFLFVLDEGGATRERYIAGRPSLQGCVFFTTPGPGNDDAAFMVINDPIKDEARIREMVARGYLVRTRADADTREARRGSRERFLAAQRSGAHVITTDYPIPDRKINPEYWVRFKRDDRAWTYDPDSAASNGFVRLNPVTVP